MVNWKSLGRYLRIILILCLLAVFLLQSILALLKHLERRTSNHSALKVRTVNPGFSTLIGRGMSRLGSHWSRAS